MSVSASFFQASTSSCIPNTVLFCSSPPFGFSRRASWGFSLPPSFSVSSCWASCPCVLPPISNTSWQRLCWLISLVGALARHRQPPQVSESAGTNAAHGFLLLGHPTGPQPAEGALPCCPSCRSRSGSCHGSPAACDTSRAHGLFPQAHEDS